MFKIISFVFLALLATACTNTNNQSNFADNTQKNYYLHMQTLADDSLNKMMAVFPPAHTHLRFTQVIDVKDLYGNFLNQGLRKKGYAILNNNAEVVDDNYYLFSYVVNNRKDDKKSYEVILNIANYRLARFYKVDSQGNLVVSSNWTLRK